MSDDLRSMLPMSFGKKYTPKKTVAAAPKEQNKFDSFIKDHKRKYAATQNFVQQGKQYDDNDDDENDDDDFGPVLPHASSKMDVDDDDNFGPMMPKQQTGDNVVIPDQVKFLDDNDEHMATQADDGMPTDQFLKTVPMSYEVKFKGHSKLLSAIAVDPKGSRFVTGGFDFKIRLYDFNMMNASLQNFREVDTFDKYPIYHIAYNLKGDKFCVAHATVKPKIFNRDGAELGEFQKGDTYINDQNQTQGHTAAVLGLKWHPVDDNFMITCGMDSTVRVWDINTFKKSQQQVIKTRTSTGTKAVCTAVCYNSGGTYIGAGCEDGSIQFWKGNGPFNKPHVVNYQAHKPGNYISSIAFSQDNNTIITRGMDDTLKVWDKRKIQTPLKVFSELLNRYQVTDCIFSPKDDFIVTGVNKHKKDTESQGSLLFIDKQTLNVVKQVYKDSSVVRVLWHDALDQIFVGCSDHTCHGYYNDSDAVKSKRGIAMSMAKEVKEKNIDQYKPVPFVLQPDRRGRMPTDRRLRNKYKIIENTQALIPQPPIKGPGKDGRIGSNSIHNMMKELNVQVHNSTDDPRQSLFKYAEDAEDNPTFVTDAYKSTQPKPIFDYESVQRELANQVPEQIDEDDAEHRFKKRPRLEK